MEQVRMVQLSAGGRMVKDVCRSRWELSAREWTNFLLTAVGLESVPLSPPLLKYVVDCGSEQMQWWFSSRFRPERPSSLGAPSPLCTKHVDEQLGLWVRVWNRERFQVQSTKRVFSMVPNIIVNSTLFVLCVQLWWTGTWTEPLCVKHTTVSWNKRNQHGDFLFYNPKVSLSAQKTHLCFPFFSESRIDF